MSVLGGEGSGVVGELGVNRYQLLPLEWISNEILLCSTGNYVQSLMIMIMGENRMCTCMCNWVSILCSRKKNCIGEITIKKITINGKKVNEDPDTKGQILYESR